MAALDFGLFFVPADKWQPSKIGPTAKNDVAAIPLPIISLSLVIQLPYSYEF